MRRLLWFVCVFAACTADKKASQDMAVSGDDLSVVPSDLAAIDQLQLAPDLEPSVMSIARIGAINVSTRGIAGDGGVATQSAASAAFSDYGINGDMGVCTRDRVGPCERTLCPLLSASRDSGDITISGGTSTQTLLYQGLGYSSLNASAALWPAGTTLTISAPGATTSGVSVPSWSGMVTMPSQPTITAPVITTSQMVPRNADLPVAWQGGSPKVSFVWSRAGISLRCDFDAAAGAGTLPSVALESIPAGDYTFLAYGLERKVISAGDWQVSLVALNPATNGTGEFFSANVTLF